MGRGQSILIPTSFPSVPCSPDPRPLLPRPRGIVASCDAGMQGHHGRIRRPLEATAAPPGQLGSCPPPVPLPSTPLPPLHHLLPLMLLLLSLAAGPWAWCRLNECGLIERCTTHTGASGRLGPCPLPIRPIRTRDRSPFTIRRLPPHPASTLHVFECALLWSDIGHCQVAGSGPMHFSTPRARRELASATAVSFPALVLHTSATRVTTWDD